MANIPWAIIVFKDRGINISRNLEKLSRTIFRYIVYLVILTALLLCYLIGISVYNRTSKIQRKPLTYKAGWIWPNKGLRFKYTCLAAFNLICFALMVISLVTADIPFKPFLYLPLINLLLAYLVILNSSLEFPSLLLTKSKRFIAPIVSLILVMIPLLTINYIKVSLTGLILVIFIVIIAYFILALVPREVKKIKNHFIYRNSHALLVYSFALLFFAHPPLMFDKISQDTDKLVDLKYYQLKLANDYSNWIKNIKLDYESQERAITINLGPGANGVYARNWGMYSIESYNTDILTDSIWKQLNKYVSLTNYFLDEINFSKLKSFSMKPSIFEKINKIIPFDNSYSEAVSYLYVDTSKETQNEYPLEWGYSKSKNEGNKEAREVIFLKYLEKPNLEYEEEGKKIEPVYIISSPQWGMVREVKAWTWIAVLVIALFVFILFYIIHFTWKAIFLGSLGISPEETAYLNNTVDEIKKLNGRFFIYGNPPGSINGLEEDSDWLVINFCKCEAVTPIREKFPTEKKFIIISHFDYMRHDARANRDKLELLEQAVVGCNATIIVYSQFEPLENFDLSGSPVENGDDTPEKANGHKYPTVIERWKRVLRQFEFKYAIDDVISSDIPAELPIPIGLSKSAAALIDRECHALEYIKPLKRHIFSEIERMADKNIGNHVIRDIIFEHAKPRYDIIWMTSTKEEKLVLIQFAREGLLNFKNREIIRQLLKRKLIELSPLRLCNITFKDYVESADDMESILKWEGTIVDSKWAAVRNPLLFLLTVIIGFLVISQPNALSTWLALIPAVTGLIPLLLRLFDELVGLRVQS